MNSFVIRKEINFGFLLPALILIIILFFIKLTSSSSIKKYKNVCDIHEIFYINKCYTNVPSSSSTSSKVPVVSSSRNNNNSCNLYIIYDVNQVEGFNLRRDVYIRMATFIWKLKQNPKYSNTKLVLPPFMNMYHWRSHNVVQNRVFWGDFFDLESLRNFTDIIDFPDFLAEINLKYPNRNKTYIDEVYKLQNYDEMFENGVFRDKFEKAPCKNDDERRRGHYFGYKNLTHRTFSCVNFQGGSKLIQKMLYKYKTTKTNCDRIVLVLRTETVLHDFWASPTYWEARRSCRFSKALTDIATKFRLDYLNSSNAWDLVQRPLLWREEKQYRAAKGGDYLAVHLRRADFLYGREKTTPTLQSAAIQIKDKLNAQNLSVIFVASDCTGNEFNDLKHYLKPHRVLKFKPESIEQFEKIRDGGVAIIDQIICSHAR